MYIKYQKRKYICKTCKYYILNMVLEVSIAKSIEMKSKAYLHMMAGMDLRFLNIDIKHNIHIISPAIV